ncbi:MAG: hypothetical protein KBT33_06505 [Prevotellaceae bacterium]|nr:hypothetical protein [Candidatus Minthosoma equi]
MKRLFVTNNRTGCAFVTVDALRNAIPFYLRNGFVVMDKTMLEDDKMDTCPLYYNLFELIED